MPDQGSACVTTATSECPVIMNNVEQATGYDYLSALPDDVERVVEARVASAP